MWDDGSLAAGSGTARDEDTSDDEMDWEEVPVELQIPVDDDSAAIDTHGNGVGIEITLEKRKTDNVKFVCILTLC